MIHHAESLETQVRSDIDIVLDRHPEDAFEPLLASLPGMHIVQRLHYEIPFGFYYVLYIDDSNGPCFLHLDVVYDPCGSNHYLYTSEELLSGRRQVGGIWTTAPALEAVYLLIKKTIKGRLDDATLALIRTRFADNPASGSSEVSRWFGAGGMPAVQRLLAAETAADAQPALVELRNLLAPALSRRGGLLGLRRVVQELKRRIYRIVHPSGLFVVVLGPDGSGKSTLVEGALSNLQRGFRATWRFHWRPGLLPKPGGGTQDTATSPADPAPPEGYAYGRFVSLVRYFYYLTDFIFGYWLIIYPKRVRTTLVFGERWYYDVIVNPARYGFRVPEWLLQAGRWLVPAPDLTVLLEAEPEAIHARKPELTVEQLETQLQQMRVILPAPPAGLRVSTTGTITESLHALSDAVLTTLQQRSVTMAGTQWRAFPGAHNARLWIQSRDSLANAMHLYHPYSWLARVVTRTAQRLPRRLSTRCATAADNQRLARLADAIDGMLGHTDSVISFSTGTPGAHRKMTAQVSRDGRIVAYVKIASSDAAKTLLDTEARTLGQPAAAQASNRFSVPQVLAETTVDEYRLLALSAPPGPGRRRGIDIDAGDIAVITTLLPAQPRVAQVSQVLEQLGLGAAQQRDTTVPACFNDAGEAATAQLGNGVRMGPAHGDYAPWNTLAMDDSRLFVFDWEHAGEAPLLNDLFHRIFMPGRLVEKTDTRALVSRLLALPDEPLTGPLVQQCGTARSDFPAYLLLYLLRQGMREISEHGAASAYLQACLHLTLAYMGHPRHRLRVLVSAYACEPHTGSEPGVGWSWVQEIARGHDAWVITRANNRDGIEAELRTNPNPHLHFAYVDLPAWARFWKRKQRGIRTYYYLWQFAAWRCARRLQRETVFDLAHHVTFVNDWLWTFLALLPLPYVWGPIGSNARCPSQLLPHTRARRIDLLRIVIQNTVRWCDPLWWLSALRARAVVTINDQIAGQLPLRLIAAGKTVVEPAVAVDPMPAPARRAQLGDRRCVLYVGRHLPVKGGALAIEAFAKAARSLPRATLVLIGEGPEEEDLRRRAREHGIEERVQFSPWQTQAEVWQNMARADVFLFPSMEGAGMVVLEAMRAGLPVVCLDFGGPGTMASEASGRKVPIGSFEQVTDGLARELITLLKDPELMIRLGEAGWHRSQALFSWEAKHSTVGRLYREILYPGVGNNDTTRTKDVTHGH